MAASDTRPPHPARIALLSPLLVALTAGGRSSETFFHIASNFYTKTDILASEVAALAATLCQTPLRHPERRGWVKLQTGLGDVVGDVIWGTVFAVKHTTEAGLKSEVNAELASIFAAAFTSKARVVDVSVTVRKNLEVEAGLSRERMVLFAHTRPRNIAPVLTYLEDTDSLPPSPFWREELIPLPGVRRFGELYAYPEGD